MEHFYRSIKLVHSWMRSSFFCAFFQSEEKWAKIRKLPDMNFIWPVWIVPWLFLAETFMDQFCNIVISSFYNEMIIANKMHLFSKIDSKFSHWILSMMLHVITVYFNWPLPLRWCVQVKQVEANIRLVDDHRSNKWMSMECCTSSNLRFSLWPVSELPASWTRINELM